MKYLLILLPLLLGCEPFCKSETYYIEKIYVCDDHAYCRVLFSNGYTGYVHFPIVGEGRRFCQ